MQQKASYVGFDWEDSKDVWNKINEELEELKIAEKNGDINHIESELGDVIFSLINLARFLDISAENALRQTNGKFKNRFRYIESKIKEKGKKFEETELNELEKYWKEAKGKE